MPQQTIYIRKADMPLWLGLENKAEFLSNALNTSLGVSSLRSEPKVIRNARMASLQERVDGLGESVELPPTIISPTHSLRTANGVCKIHATPP